MMEIVKNFLFCFVVSVFISCASTHWDKSDNVSNDGICNNMLHYFSMTEFDSICNSDTIPTDLENGWITTPLKDYETKEEIKRYLFIKERNNKEIIYVVTLMKNDSCHLVKRSSRGVILD